MNCWYIRTIFCNFGFLNGYTEYSILIISWQPFVKLSCSPILRQYENTSLLKAILLQYTFHVQTVLPGVSVSALVFGWGAQYLPETTGYGQIQPLRPNAGADATNTWIFCIYDMTNYICYIIWKNYYILQKMSMNSMWVDLRYWSWGKEV